MLTTSNTEFLEQIQYLVGLGRYRQAVEFLNLSSPYRFTALYRISTDHLQSLVIYDREAESQPAMHTIPLVDSYCVFVRDLKDAFIVSDSTSDVRVEGHPKRPTVQSYCGVPLLNMQGEVSGTVCHFDFAAVPEDPAALDLLRTFAGIFDPVRTSELLERGVSQGVDALEAMLGLLVETCDGIADTIVAFEEFARPVREELLQLNDGSRGGAEARIDELLNSLPSRYAKKSQPAL